VRPRAGIENDRGSLIGSGMQPSDHLGLGVGLEHLHVQS
jgi:hypothetical protein